MYVAAAAFNVVGPKVESWSVRLSSQEVEIVLSHEKLRSVDRVGGNVDVILCKTTAAGNQARLPGARKEEGKAGQMNSSTGSNYRIAFGRFISVSSKVNGGPRRGARDRHINRRVESSAGWIERWRADCFQSNYLLGRETHRRRSITAFSLRVCSPTPDRAVSLQRNAVIVSGVNSRHISKVWDLFGQGTSIATPGPYGAITRERQAEIQSGRDGGHASRQTSNLKRIWMRIK